MSAPALAREAEPVPREPVAQMPVAHAATDVGTAIPGVEELLPPGERLLWTGAPDARTLARHALHARTLAIYFGALVLLRVLTALDEPHPMALITIAAVWLVPLGALTVAFAHVLATVVARGTVYALTDRRVVMKVGVGVPITINLPLKQIESVALLEHRDGSGDVALTLVGDVRVAYLLLWPHARPRRFAKPQPTLRGIADAARIGRMVSEAVAAVPADETQETVSRASRGVAGPPAGVATPGQVVPLPNGPRPVVVR